MRVLIGKSGERRGIYHKILEVDTASIVETIPFIAGKNGELLTKECRCIKLDCVNGDCVYVGYRDSYATDKNMEKLFTSGLLDVRYADMVLCNPSAGSAHDMLEFENYTKSCVGVIGTDGADTDAVGKPKKSGKGKG